MKERKNVYKLPAGDKTLEWYGKAVIEMKKRPASDPRSWYYQAGMHKFDPNSPFWQPATPPLPSTAERKIYWGQCQHGSWFFLPWHRMYLAYFEEIVAQTIVDIGGPKGWALPFWDYSDKTNAKALTIPAAFTSPAKAGNGLWITSRGSNKLHKADVDLVQTMKATNFSGSTSNFNVSFGGGESPVNPNGLYHGQLEITPHGLVHDAIGGAMGSTLTAGLDPIFWLHHANIDRLWQVWLNQGGNRVNPVQSAWLDQKFSFHDKAGNKTELKCSDVVDSTKVLTGYKYQGVTPPAPAVTAPATNIASFNLKDFSMPLEVVAATNKTLSLTSDKTVISLKLTPPPAKSANLASIASVGDIAADKPQASILHFENITGKGVPPTQRVYLNVSDGDGDKDVYYAGSISLFGVAEASKPSLHNSGSGQHQSLDITELMNTLRTLPNWNEKKLEITIEPARPMDAGSSVKIGRISLYSE